MNKQEVIEEIAKALDILSEVGSSLATANIIRKKVAKELEEEKHPFSSGDIVRHERSKDGECDGRLLVKLEDGEWKIDWGKHGIQSYPELVLVLVKKHPIFEAEDWVDEETLGPCRISNRYNNGTYRIKYMYKDNGINQVGYQDHVLGHRLSILRSDRDGNDVNKKDSKKECKKECKKEDSG